MQSSLPDPWLTVVTISLRDDSNLARTVSSVEDQDLAGVEHIVVLAEPSLNLRDTEGRHAYRRIVVVPPSGVYHAMNCGLNEAAGSLVHFLNAGDEYAAADVISSVRAIYERERFLWAFGRMLVSRSDDEPGKIRGVTWEKMRVHKFRGMNFPEHPTVFTQTDVLVGLGGFDTSYRSAADYRLLLQLATEYPGLDLNLIITRFSLGGVSDAEWVESVLECFRARTEYLKPSGLAAVIERIHLCAALANQLARRTVRAFLGVGSDGSVKGSR